MVVIIGPSGSGKSTLLRCINKLEEISAGQLIIDGMDVSDPKVDERLIRQEAGMVFQQFYLFPHLTALENVMFGPIRVRHMKKEDAENAHVSCWRKSACLNVPITIRLNFLAVSNSVWLLPVRWPLSRK